jgi:hypothetical protein
MGVKPGREEEALKQEQSPSSIARGLSPARRPRTRTNTRQLSGHFSAEVVQAWRVLVAEQDMESQELLAMGINLVFEHFGKPTRVALVSGRRKKTKP